MTRPPYHFALGNAEPGAWSLHSIANCHVETIGRSRENRELFGIVAGHGPLRVSVVAGAHADEPVGPRTAVRLAESLALGGESWARDLAGRATFYIVPHANPDGDTRNSSWQSDPLDFLTWLRDAKREPPGGDVEFNYPRGADDRATRPENLAVADFLRAQNKTFHVHASLHSMGFAEGAWYLVCREWADRARERGLFERLAQTTRDAGLALHDFDRAGEKGFHRLAPGFCTTPRSEAMHDYFLERNDPKTAALFRPSSMEFVASLGGDPLCIVSELPMFELRAARESTAPQDERPFAQLRDMIPKLRAAAERDEAGAVEEAIQQFGIAPVPWSTQRDLQIAFLREAIRAVELRGSI